jgi:hypothetical protein
MKDLRGKARVSAFLRKSLAEGAQDVLKLEAMARGEALLGERQRITDAKAFKLSKVFSGHPPGELRSAEGQERVEPD